MIKITYIVDEMMDLYSFLKQKYFTEEMILRLLFLKKIYVNQKVVKDNQMVLVKDRVEFDLENEKCEIPSFNAPINIVYEDDYLLVVNKPANLDTLRSKRHSEDNLSTRIIHYYQKNKILSTIHFVNRLDYMTQGLILIAKHGSIHQMFKHVEMIKKYQLKVHGKMLVNQEEEIKVYIKKSNDGIKRIVSNDGKEAITRYQVLKSEQDYTYLQAQLVTGRTHQLRVTFSNMGHPIVGDTLYGSFEKTILNLCSSYLEFEHPITKKRMKFEIHPNF